MTGTVLTERELAAVFASAEAAGMAAAEARVPVPMVVEQHESPFEPTSPVVKRWGPIMEGVCGFAWVTIRPGTSRAAKFAKRVLGARKGYHGGMEIWVSRFGQSMERKEAFAEAFAATLRAAGIEAHAGSRMD